MYAQQLLYYAWYYDGINRTLVRRLLLYIDSF